MTSALRAPARTPLLQVAKSIIATAAAWIVAGWIVGGAPPVFAAIAALLVVQPSVNQSLAKAVERSVGVIVGVAIASGLGLVFGDASWVVLVALALALLMAWALRMTPGTSNQVAISALLVLVLGTSTPGYALDRILETLIGAVMGIVVNAVVVPPVQLAPARQRTGVLGRELAASLDRLAIALKSEQSPAQLEELMLQARLMRPMRDGAEQAISAAEESLTLNPRGGSRRAELHALRAAVERLSPVVTQVIGMTRAVYDRYEPGLAAEPSVRAIAEQLHRAAHDVRRHTGGAAPEPALDTAPVPALTTPLQVLRPPAQWVLVGSLLEDLRRVHEEMQQK
ncbi:hypothetical protein GCM10025738_16520 [Microbacterium fluvii]